MKLTFIKFLILFCLTLQNKEDINGKYMVTTEIISGKDSKPCKITYYFSINKKKMIVSIKSKNVQDYWCEGVFELKKEGNVLHGFGPCSDENHDNDIYVKKNKNDVFVKSKSFIIKDWLELKKQ